MKKNLSWLSLLLVFMLAVTACSGNSGGNSASGGNKEANNPNLSGSKEEPYEVVYAYPSFSNIPADNQEVQEAINKISIEKINVKVKLLPISNSAFTNQINLMLSSGEKLDMFAMLGNYSTQIAKGALYPIGNIMEENAQGTIDALGSDYYNATKVGGISYGVPSLRDMAQDFGIVVRKDVVDKYNINLDNVKIFNDFEQIFKTLKENEPEMAGATNVTNGSILSTYGIQDPLGNNLGVLLNHGLDNLKVVNLFASEEYKQIVSKIREWYLAGYLVKDPATSPESNDVMVKTGKAAGWLSAMKPGFETQQSRTIGLEMTAARTQAPVAMTDTVTNVTLGIAANSVQPEKALQFLNLMYTDKDIVNLIDWGIEGKHYVKIEGSDNVIKYPEGITGDNVGYKSEGWMHGNQFLSYVFEGDDPEMYVKMNEFNQSAAKSKALGFTFNGDSLKAEIAACNAVLDQYRRAIESGVLELDKALPEFLKKLDDAGINKIITEKQKQLDEWAAGNTSK